MPVPGPGAEAVMAEVWVRDWSVPRSSSSAHPAPTLQINTSIMYTSRSECLPPRFRPGSPVRPWTQLCRAHRL